MRDKRTPKDVCGEATHKAPVMQARITLTVFGLFCYYHSVIRQDHGFGSPSDPHRLPGWLCA